MRVEEVSKALVFIFHFEDYIFLIAHLFKKSCCMRLKLSIHVVGRIELIISCT